MAQVGNAAVNAINNLEIEYKERQRASLYELLSSLGYDASAAALYAAPGVLTIPRSLADTRDGREEIIAQVSQGAFEEPSIGVIIIQDGKPLGRVLQELHPPNTRTAGYA